jgi:hypothetical protein
MESCHGLLIPHSSVPHAPLFPLCSLQTPLEYACLTDHVAFSTEPHHLQHMSQFLYFRMLLGLDLKWAPGLLLLW